MRSKEEIKDRLKKLESMLELNEELGHEGIRSYNKNKTYEEINALRWVLGEERPGINIKGRTIYYSPQRDKILVYMKKVKRPVSSSELKGVLGIPQPIPSMKKLEEDGIIRNLIKNPGSHNPYRWEIKK